MNYKISLINQANSKEPQFQLAAPFTLLALLY